MNEWVKEIVNQMQLNLNVLAPLSGLPDGAPTKALIENSFELLRAEDWTTCRRCCEHALTICWEQLHHGEWKLVNVAWRSAYEMSALIKVMCFLVSEELREALKLVDLALMIGAQTFSTHLHQLALCIHDLLPPFPAPRHNIATINDNIVVKIQHPMPIVDCPSLQWFHDECIQKEQAVIIKHLIDDWKAMHHWNTATYLTRICGWRTVPVETGRSYSSADVGSRLMVLGEYINSVFDGECDSYLAQHTLFDQIEPLKSDIEIPIYCMLNANDDDEDGDDIRINAWLGPEGTISPLHVDEPHNILCQVVGRKYIRIYHRKWTPNMYPHSSGALSNTSQVDAENPDLQRFPLFAQAEYTEHILSPGEALYIPPMHWHYVRALDQSFSVSFWWQ